MNDSLLQQAEAITNRKDWSNAAVYWRRYREAHPDKILGYVKEIEAFRSMTEYAEALKLAFRALERFPLEKEALTQIAEVYMHVKNWRSAAQYWETLRQHFPENQLGYTRAAIAHHYLGDAYIAQALSRQAMRKFPTNAQGYIEYSKALTITADPQMRDWEKVVEFSQLFRETFPSHFYGYTKATEALRFLKEFDKAYELGIQAVKLFANQPICYLELLDILIATKKWEEAESYIQIMRDKWPQTTPQAYKSFINIFKNQKKYATAMKVAQEFLCACPERIDPYYELSLLYMELGELDSAIDYFHIMQDIFPMNHLAYYECSKAWMKKGDIVKAERELDNYLKVAFNKENDAGFSLTLLLKPRSFEFCAQVHKDNPNFSREYYDEVTVFPPIVQKDLSLILQDSQDRWQQVENGIRKTVGNPEQPENSVYFLGACNLYGAYTGDEDTVSTHLQQLCNRHGKNLAIVNMGMPGSRLETMWLTLRNRIRLKSGDYVAIYLQTIFQPEIPAPTQVKRMQEYCESRGVHFIAVINKSFQTNFLKSAVECILAPTTYDPVMIKNAKMKYQHYVNTLTSIGCNILNLHDDMERPHDMGITTFDTNGHLTPSFYRHMADNLYTYFISRNNENISEEDMDRNAVNYIKYYTKLIYRGNKKFKNWLDSIPKPENGANLDIGSVVMNCNPFTSGHLYLIETASEFVDILYIFVVEEDLSFFPFSDRLELVKQGCGHLKHKVIIVPSGEFIISSTTFDDYFRKENIEGMIDASQDVTIFASLIAPSLNIKHRFAGEEPSCQVTNQYNSCMKDLLPYLGINFQVFERKKQGSSVISASSVRKYLEAKDFEAISKIVPPSTYQYLVTRYS